MTIVITISYIVYKVRKKSKNPPVYNVPKVIVSKHNKDKKESVPLPPPKPAPLKVKVDVPKTQPPRMQPVQAIRQSQPSPPSTGAGVQPVLQAAQPQPSAPKPVQPQVEQPPQQQYPQDYPPVAPQVTQQMPPQVSRRTLEPGVPAYPVNQYEQFPQYTNPGDKQNYQQRGTEEFNQPASRPTVFRTTGQTYPRVTQVNTPPQTTVKSPGNRFQVLNKPPDLPQTSLNIAYYGTDRLSYQPPKYLKINQDQ